MEIHEIILNRKAIKYRHLFFLHLCATCVQFTNNQSETAYTYVSLLQIRATDQSIR